MRHKWYLLTGLCVLVLILLLNHPVQVAGQAAGVTYQNPLFYTGEDGNIYVTSLDATGATALTSDGMGRTYRLTEITAEPRQTEYSMIDWPVDGPKYYAQRWDKGSCFLLESGSKVRDLTYSQQETASVSSEADGCSQPSFGGPGGCHIAAYPNDSDLAVMDEANTVFFTHPAPTVFAVKGGYLVDESTSCLIFSRKAKSYLSSHDAVVVWSNNELCCFVLSPDRTQAVANHLGGDDQRVLVNLSSGDVQPLNIDKDTDVLAVVPDRKLLLTVTSKLAKKKEIADAPGNFEQDYLLTLWRQPLDGGKPSKLFEVEGYGLARPVFNLNETKVVFSIVANRNVQPDTPQVQLVAVPLDGGQADWIAVGGKPVFGKGSFAAVPESFEKVTPPKKCAKSLVSHLKIGQRAKVTPGIPNNLRSLPAGGSVLRKMPGESKFLILDGPKCGADGLAWWRVNYHGAVGWTAESDSKTYWLEQ